MTRYVFQLQGSRDAAYFERLKAERYLYRLALGQPHPEDLVSKLARAPKERRQLLHSLSLNLSPVTTTLKMPPVQEIQERPTVNAA